MARPLGFRAFGWVLEVREEDPLCFLLQLNLPINAQRTSQVHACLW